MSGIKSVLKEFNLSHYHKQAKQEALAGLKGFNKGLRTWDKLDRYIYGLRKECYYLIVGEAKAGKTLFLTKFLTNALLDNKATLGTLHHRNIHVLWFSLEMTGKFLRQRMMSEYISRVHGEQYSFADLQGYTNKKLTEEQIHTLYDEAEEEISSMLSDCYIFEQAASKEDVMDLVTEYMMSIGSIKTTDVGSIYTYNNDKDIVIVIVDHTALIAQGKDENDEFHKIREFSKNMALLRNKFKICGIVVNQASRAVANIANKDNDYHINRDHIYGGSTVIHDANIVLTINNPVFHRIPEYPSKAKEKYILSKLPTFRSIELLANREGESNVIVPMYFDFKNNNIVELPKPSKLDYEALLSGSNQFTIIDSISN